MSTPASLTPVPTPTPDPPQAQVTLLLLSGARKTFSFPPDTTVGRVKELVWGSWPVEWRDETLPPSPSYFRLLHLGRLLQDDSTLITNNLYPSPTPQIVHLSVKSFVPSIDASASKPKKSARSAGGGGGGGEAEGEHGGCCGGCVIM